MPVIAVIPARYGSTRLPAKALADIDGVPMVVRVWKQVSLARSIERVIVATDDERIAAPVRAAGGEAMMTSATHQSGTDRIAEVAAKVHADIYINVQGDQPFTDPRDLDAVAAPMLTDVSIDMATLATPIADLEEFRNPTKVKVVCDCFRQRAVFLAQSDSPCAAISKACRPERCVTSASMRIGATSCSSSRRSRPENWSSSKSWSSFARSKTATASGWSLPWRRRLR